MAEEEEEALKEYEATGQPGPPTAYVCNAFRARLDEVGEYTSKVASILSLRSAMPQKLAEAKCTTGQPGSLGGVGEDTFVSTVFPKSTTASLMLGLGVLVSQFGSASSSADFIDDTSTCVYTVGPTGQPGVTMWWVCWHAVITTLRVISWTSRLTKYAKNAYPSGN